MYRAEFLISMARLEIGQEVIAPSTSYVVNSILGEGTFGEVALCRKRCSDETVALKLIKNQKHVNNGKNEAAILQFLRERDSEHHHIVRWFNSFEYRDTYCLEFERLDISLCDYIELFNRMSLMQIRPVIYQMAEALRFLSTLGIVHGDVKPENILLVDQVSGFQVKLIDFGAAHLASCVRRGDITQTSWYRAPEVLLGVKYNQAIDMWSLGCIAVEMLTGKVLFPGVNSKDMVRHIVKTVGTPPSSLLHRGAYTFKYFHQRSVRCTQRWRLKSCVLRRRYRGRERAINNIEDLYQRDTIFHDTSSTEKELDWEYFIDMVIKMLNLDPQERITPEGVLEHTFISMRHMLEVFNTEHVSQCVEMMRCAHLDQNHPDRSATIHNQERDLEEHYSSENAPESSPISIQVLNDVELVSSLNHETSGESRKRSREEEPGEEGSSSEKKRKCEATMRYKSKNRKGVTFVVNSEPRTPEAGPSNPQQETSQDTHRPNLRRKKTPYPREIPPVDSSSNNNNSGGSKKRSREPEETEHQRHVQDLHRMPNLKKREKTPYSPEVPAVESFSPSNESDEKQRPKLLIRWKIKTPKLVPVVVRLENKETPSLEIMRPESSPIPILVPIDEEQVLSSNRETSRGSRKRSGEEEDGEEERCFLVRGEKRRRPTPPKT